MGEEEKWGQRAVDSEQPLASLAKWALNSTLLETPGASVDRCSEFPRRCSCNAPTPGGHCSKIAGAYVCTCMCACVNSQELKLAVQVAKSRGSPMQRKAGAGHLSWAGQLSQWGCGGPLLPALCSYLWPGPQLLSLARPCLSRREAQPHRGQVHEGGTMRPAHSNLEALACHFMKQQWVNWRSTVGKNKSKSLTTLVSSPKLCLFPFEGNLSRFVKSQSLEPRAPGGWAFPSIPQFCSHCSAPPMLLSFKDVTCHLFPLVKAMSPPCVCSMLVHVLGLVGQRPVSLVGCVDAARGRRQRLNLFLYQRWQVQCCPWTVQATLVSGINEWMKHVCTLDSYPQVGPLENKMLRTQRVETLPGPFQTALSGWGNLPGFWWSLLGFSWIELSGVCLH